MVRLSFTSASLKTGTCCERKGENFACFVVADSLIYFEPQLASFLNHLLHFSILQPLETEFDSPYF